MPWRGHGNGEGTQWWQYMDGKEVHSLVRVLCALEGRPNSKKKSLL